MTRCQTCASVWQQDELPIDWTQVAKDYASDIEHYEDDQEPEAVAQAFDLGPKGVTAAPIPQTAFLVVIAADGDAEAYADINRWPDQVERTATLGDMRRGCSEIVTEINVQAGARLSRALLEVERPVDRVREALAKRGVRYPPEEKKT